MAKIAKTLPVLQKARTGIQGLDEITNGGLPQGRPTLVCGGPGSGKTLLAMEFLVRGAMQFGEPGVFVSFEEREGDLVRNFASLGFDLHSLSAAGKLFIDNVRVERNELEETGEYDLEGLFIRIGAAIDTTRAKRIVLDTIESLFASLPNEAILRAELRRLFGWLKDRGMTAIITGERGQNAMTRRGLEEYVSDCVILLDHRIVNQISTRRLTVVKYRGSLHGTNEYPFFIDQNGILIIPVTSLGLDHQASDERIPSGLPRLDTMLGGGGYYRGSTILVSGTAGTGKTSLAAHFVRATCERGERCLYLAFEESADQITRNMRSIGIDYQPFIDKKILRIRAERPALQGLEAHLAAILKIMLEFKPGVVILDPVTDLIAVGNASEVKIMLTRLIDLLKSHGVTALITTLTQASSALEQSEVGISSLMDTWLLLKDIERNGERNRGLYIIKSRGMAHSNQIREFVLTDTGVELVDVYVGPAGVLTGSARLAQAIEEKSEEARRAQEIARKKLTLEQKRKALDARIKLLQADFDIEAAEIAALAEEEDMRRKTEANGYKSMAQSRKAD
ncbi:MAG: circadian clock protein KaiC [Thermodesulfobacteriota bacterium]